jgi:hypothetical protein
MQTGMRGHAGAKAVRAGAGQDARLCASGCMDGLFRVALALGSVGRSDGAFFPSFLPSDVSQIFAGTICKIEFVLLCFIPRVQVSRAA